MQQDPAILHAQTQIDRLNGRDREEKHIAIVLCVITLGIHFAVLAQNLSKQIPE